MLPAFVAILLCIPAVCASSVTIGRYQCDETFEVKDTTIFTYNGDDLPLPCTFTVQQHESVADSELCITATRYDTTCNMDVFFHYGIVYRIPDGEASCSATDPHKDYCVNVLPLNVEFKSSSGYTRGSRIELKAYIKQNNVGLIVGVIVGVLAFIGIVSLVVVLICRRRRSQKSTGMVVNQGQPMQATAPNQTQYPARDSGHQTQPFLQQQQQPQYYPPGNQQQQQYYPPGNQQQQQPYYPTAGNQPAGFNPPMAGFSTLLAASYEAGSQPPPSYESLGEKNPSAPPL